MNCLRCGSQNEESARYCASCGAPFQGGAPIPPQPQQAVPSYLAQAILVTLFCCMPFGVVSIVYAAQVNGKLAVGDMAGARSASESAKTWAWVSFGVGLLLYPVVFFFSLLGELAG